MRAHTLKRILFLFVDGESLGRSVKCVSGIGFLASGWPESDSVGHL